MGEAIGSAFGLSADWDSTNADYWDACYRKCNGLQLGFAERGEFANRDKALGAMFYCLLRGSLLRRNERTARMAIAFLLGQMRLVFPQYARRDIDAERLNLLRTFGLS